LLPLLDAWLADIFHPNNLDDTCRALAEASQGDQIAPTRIAAARRKIAECNDRPRKYRTVLESGADPGLIAEWTIEVQAEPPPRRWVIFDHPNNRRSGRPASHLIAERGP
jgi:hypothetical protein